MTFSVAQDAFAAESGYLCVARDVTEQRQSQEMLIAALDKERTAVEQLRSLDQAKNEFVSTVSHELRTPVTSIVGYTEMLQDGSMVDPLPDQVPLLDSIHRNGAAADLDDQRPADAQRPRLRRACTGRATPSTWPRSSARRGRDPAAAHRPDARARVVPPAPPVPVTGDRAQLERVAINLLSNAIKFTEDGGSITHDGGTRGRRGRAQGQRHRHRHPGRRAGRAVPALLPLLDRPVERRSRAPVSGLSIVAAIVSAHGGRIDVDSAHLAGTTFTVRLPMAKSQRLTAAR